MAYKETFWMACDSTEQLCAEYGPFHTRSEAEMEARKLGFHFLLRYEHVIGVHLHRTAPTRGDHQPGRAQAAYPLRQLRGVGGP